MRASGLAIRSPIVRARDSFLGVRRRMVEQHLPGVIVIDADDRPIATLNMAAVVGAALDPIYLLGPGLPRAVGEEDFEQTLRDPVRLRVADCLPTSPARPAQVSPDATLVEVAAVMVRRNTPLVAVVDPHGRAVGAVTAAAVLTQLTAREDYDS